MSRTTNQCKCKCHDSDNPCYKCFSALCQWFENNKKKYKELCKRFLRMLGNQAV